MTRILKWFGRFSCSPFEMRQSYLVFRQLFIQAALAAAVQEGCVVAEVGPTAPSKPSYFTDRLNDRMLTEVAHTWNPLLGEEKSWLQSYTVKAKAVSKTTAT